MPQAELSPQESLLLIDTMINKARNRFTENGFMHLLWGWLIFACALLHFIFVKFEILPHPEIVWGATWLAVIFQVIYFSRKKKKEKVKTYSDGIINGTWVSFGMCMFILIFILNRYDIWPAVFPLILMMYGIPTFLSGTAMQFTPLKIGGVICWVLSITATFVPPLYVLLLLALAVIAAWIVPGYIMRNRYNKQNTNQ